MRILNLQNRLRRGITMNKPILRYILSPVLTLLTLILIDQAIRWNLLAVSLAFPVGVMALCLFWSGLRANVLSAIFISAYAFYSSDFDPSRAGQIAFMALAVAIGGGVMRRWLIESVRETERQRLRANENQEKADFVDNLNGNIETIKEINRELIELSNALGVLSKPQIRDELNRIQNKAANLAQRTVGWSQLALAKKTVTGEE